MNQTLYLSSRSAVNVQARMIQSMVNLRVARVAGHIKMGCLFEMVRGKVISIEIPL